jgi:hypothetical protein
VTARASGHSPRAEKGHRLTSMLQPPPRLLDELPGAVAVLALPWDEPGGLQIPNPRHRAALATLAGLGR